MDGSVFGQCVGDRLLVTLTSLLSDRDLKVTGASTSEQRETQALRIWLEKAVF